MPDIPAIGFCLMQFLTIWLWTTWYWGVKRRTWVYEIFIIHHWLRMYLLILIPMKLWLGRGPWHVDQFAFQSDQQNDVAHQQEPGSTGNPPDLQILRTSATENQDWMVPSWSIHSEVKKLLPLRVAGGGLSDGQRLCWCVDVWVRASNLATCLTAMKTSCLAFPKWSETGGFSFYSGRVETSWSHRHRLFSGRPRRSPRPGEGLQCQGKNMGCFEGGWLICDVFPGRLLEPIVFYFLWEFSVIVRFFCQLLPKLESWWCVAERRLPKIRKRQKRL